MSRALFEQSATELRRELDSGQTTSRELADALLERVDAVDGTVNAFLHLDADAVRAEAEAADARRAKGERLSAIDGLPVALKNVIAVKDRPLTCASRMLRDFVSPYDATVTTRLRQAGAILFGDVNMDEFAMGSSTENSAVQETANPWSLECAPGGSSGGSAAVVAAGMSPLSLGSDTGGSIRQPAAFCGVVGVKPTYGFVSRFGLVAFASSLDQIGPMARTVEDAAMLLQVVAGHDSRDSTSIRTEIPDYLEALRGEPRKWRVGVPKEYFGEGLDAEVRAKVQAAVDFYRSAGCEIVDVSLPHTELAIPVYYIIATAEASSNLARYDGVRYGHRSDVAENAIDLYFKSRGEGFGEEVKRRIILGTYVLSSGYYDAWYVRAQKVRTLIRNDFLNAFNDVDVLLTPTTPTPAFRRGEKKDDPLSMYLADIFTISVNLAGLPGVSLPCGFSGDGRPIGFQLIGKPFGECELLRVARHFESAHPFANQLPSNLG